MLRADRAVHLAHLGELSAVRQAFLAPPLAPADEATLQALQDPSRRPPQYAPLDPDIRAFSPDVPLALSREILISNLRRSRRGAAPGPSGYTAEMLRPVLDDPAALEALHAVAELLARALLPTLRSASAASSLLASPLVGCGASLSATSCAASWRVRSRSSSWEPSARPPGRISTRCPPVPGRISTRRAGAEALAHSLHIEFDLDPSLTVLSVEGVGAFDLISRQAMLAALHGVPDACRALPFVRLFYGSPSEFPWTDGDGAPHSIYQAEGGEQGDPLMPALFALGLAPALRALQAELIPGEPARAFLDDIYTSPVSQAARPSCLIACRSTSSSTRTYTSTLQKPVFGTPAAPRRPHSRARQARNQPGWGMPASQQPNVVSKFWGTPLGTDEFVAAHLDSLSAQHRTFLEPLPRLPDLQVAWLMLLYCACPRAQYVLRILPPAFTAAFAAEHDHRLLSCLAQLLQVEASSDSPLAAGSRCPPRPPAAPAWRASSPPGHPAPRHFCVPGRASGRRMACGHPD